MNIQFIQFTNIIEYLLCFRHYAKYNTNGQQIYEYKQMIISTLIIIKNANENKTGISIFTDQMIYVQNVFSRVVVLWNLSYCG